MAKAKWDLTSTHSLEAAAEWLRVRSGALIVVVIRPHDGVLAADELIDVIDVHDRLWDESMPLLLRGLKERREAKRGKQMKTEAKR